MYQVLTLDSDVVALYQTRSHSSEVWLIKRNEGLIGRLTLPQKGKALQRRLERSFRNVTTQPQNHLP